ncbi:MAG: hypothetical protein ACFNXU_00930 [Kingella sp. (in: b-proteobacteria)]|jgi:hypothetical protein
MKLPENSCLKCQHASSVEGLSGFAQCAFADVGRYRSMMAGCENGKFEMASNVHQRLVWWERRQNARVGSI